METMSDKTKFFNKNLQIIKLENYKLYDKSRRKYICLDGYFLYIDFLGLISFGNMQDDILLPYEPIGGKTALESIIDGGGFLNYDNIHFLTIYK